MANELEQTQTEKDELPGQLLLFPGESSLQPHVETLARNSGVKLRVTLALALLVLFSAPFVGLALTGNLPVYFLPLATLTIGAGLERISKFVLSIDKGKDFWAEERISTKSLDNK